MRFPTIEEVSAELRRINKQDSADDGDDGGIDVRLQVHPDGTWTVNWGSSDYDQDHRGYWGSSSVPGDGRRFDSKDIARDLIEQAREHKATGGNDGMSESPRMVRGTQENKKTTGIRSYGPGKFIKLIDSYAFDVTLDGGADEEASYPEGSGWYGFLNLNSASKENIRVIAAEQDDELTDEEDDLLIESVAIIFFERSDGIVEADWFDSLKKAQKVWGDIEEDVNSDEEEEHDDDEEEDE